jgi:hypothetical protein
MLSCPSQPLIQSPKLAMNLFYNSNKDASLLVRRAPPKSSKLYSRDPRTRNEVERTPVNQRVVMAPSQKNKKKKGYDKKATTSIVDQSEP